MRVKGVGFTVAHARGARTGPWFRVQGSGCRVQGAGFRVQGAGFRVQGSGFRVQGSGFRVQGSGFRVQGSGFRVQGSGFRIDREHPIEGRTGSRTRRAMPLSSRTWCRECAGCRV